MFAELRARVVAANRTLVDAGLVVLTFGNASAIDRERGVLAIKPSGVPVDTLLPRHVPVVDLATGVVVAGSARPSSDLQTHLVLARAFGWIGGIVHTHSPFATAWAQARRPIPCLGTTHADHFAGSVPVTRELTRAEIDAGYEEATGAAIVELQTDSRRVPAALVSSHGPFAWGASVEEAVANAIALEAVAAGATRALGIAADLEEISAGLQGKHYERKHGRSASYGQRG